MKKKILITAISLILVGAIGFGSVKYIMAHRNKGEAEVYPVNMISTQNWNDQQYTYGNVQTGMIQNIYLDGTTQVKQVYVSEGDPVKIGDPIISYDTTLLELNLERQKLSIQSQELAQELLMQEIEKWKAWVPSYVSRIDSGEGTEGGDPPPVDDNKENEESTQIQDPEDSEPRRGDGDGSSSSSESSSDSEPSSSSSEPDSSSSQPDSSSSQPDSSSSQPDSSSSQPDSSSSEPDSSNSEPDSSSSEPDSSSSEPDSSNSEPDSSSSEPDSSNSEPDSSSSESDSSSGPEESSSQPDESQPVNPDSDPDPTQPDKDLEPGAVIIIGGTGTMEDPLQAVVLEGATDLSSEEFEKVRGKVVRFSIRKAPTIPEGSTELPTEEQLVSGAEQYAVVIDLTAAEALEQSRIFSLKITFQQIRSTVGVLTVYQLKPPGTITIYYPMPYGTEMEDMRINGVGDASDISGTVRTDGMTAAFQLEQGGLFIITSSEPAPEPEPKPEPEEGSEMSEPEESEESSEIIEPVPEPSYDPGYTYDEIVKILREKESKYIAAAVDLKLAKIEYQKAQKQFESLTVRSQVNGYVKSMGDPEQLMGQPYIVLAAEEGFFVTGTMSELQIEKAKYGQNIIINSWMSGMQYTGTIVKVSDYPTSSNYYSGGNPNASYYEFTARVDQQPGENIQLMNGEGVDIMILQEAEIDAEAFYIPNMYIRTENGESYVMKMGEDGLLVKQVIVRGGSLWGSYTEIREGLTQDDFIAFPYGVSEGMQTKVADGYGMYY